MNNQKRKRNYDELIDKKRCIDILSDFEKLPNDIYKEIMYYFPNRYQAIFSRLNKRWNALSKEFYSNSKDILFVIDATGSMNLFWDHIKIRINNIIKTEKEHESRFGLILYQDHKIPFRPDVIYTTMPFTKDPKPIMKKYEEQQDFLGSGFDVHEAIADALNAANNEFEWRDNRNEKFAILLADAPSHGTKITNTLSEIEVKDNFPDGCPCRLKESVILQRMQNKGITLIICPLNDCIMTPMIHQYKKHHDHVLVKNLHYLETFFKC